MKAKLVQDTYVSSVIQSLPQQNGVIDVSQVSLFALNNDEILIVLSMLKVLCEYSTFRIKSNS